MPVLGCSPNIVTPRCHYNHVTGVDGSRVTESKSKQNALHCHNLIKPLFAQQQAPTCGVASPDEALCFIILLSCRWTKGLKYCNLIWRDAAGNFLSTSIQGTSRGTFHIWSVISFRSWRTNEREICRDAQRSRTVKTLFPNHPLAFRLSRTHLWACAV